MAKAIYIYMILYIYKENGKNTWGILGKMAKILGKSQRLSLYNNTLNLAMGYIGHSYSLFMTCPAL